MKRVISIIGPNGVGKSTTARELLALKENAAWVDSEWCRVMNHFVFTESTKQTVTENIYCLLHNYLYCSDINTVIFTHGWHGERKEIYDSVFDKLKNDGLDFQNHIIVLKCSKEENIKRAKSDGRDEDRINRGMEQTFSFYDSFNYPIVDTTNMTPKEVAKTVMKLTH